MFILPKPAMFFHVFYDFLLQKLKIGRIPLLNVDAIHIK